MNENSDKKARALGINHVVLEVDDLDKALEFYSAIFDFKLRGKSDHNAFIDLGDQFIQLTLGRTQVADTKRHFGFVVDDREAVKRALDKLGIKSINDRLNILDPWGNRIENRALRRYSVHQGRSHSQGHGRCSLAENIQCHGRAQEERHGAGRFTFSPLAT